MGPGAGSSRNTILVILFWGLNRIDSHRLGQSLASAAVLLPVFVLRERAVSHPVLLVRLLCSGQVARGSIISALIGFCLAGGIFVLAQSASSPSLFIAAGVLSARSSLRTGTGLRGTGTGTWSSARWRP
ncbi:MAG: hypothetical protein ACYC5N_00640 [Endomicrobiales bacterium]